MAKTMKRRFCLYGDSVEVVFTFDDTTNRYFGEYPDFDLSPRSTPCGKQWVNATKDDCEFADSKYNDCGSCQYYKCECDGDLIGVCENEQLRKDVK